MRSRKRTSPVRKNGRTANASGNANASTKRTGNEPRRIRSWIVAKLKKAWSDQEARATTRPHYATIKGEASRKV